MVTNINKNLFLLRLNQYYLLSGNGVSLFFNLKGEFIAKLHSVIILPNLNLHSFPNVITYNIYIKSIIYKLK
jgi:hypothetical protein